MVHRAATFLAVIGRQRFLETECGFANDVIQDS